ncbi:MAG: hypothetical protein JRH20_28670, partial [Deltaproteobacteria bacterium]|nr:hypothetical protein [Deltaproteobacteria bacterium]
MVLLLLTGCHDIAAYGPSTPAESQADSQLPDSQPPDSQPPDSQPPDSQLPDSQPPDSTVLDLAMAVDSAPAHDASSLTPDPCAAKVWPTNGTTITIQTANAASLASTVANAIPYTTILLANGTYDLTSTLNFDTPGVILRGASGDQNTVTLTSSKPVEPLIRITASEVILADMTITVDNSVAVDIEGGSSANTLGVRIHHVLFSDAGGRDTKGADTNQKLLDSGGAVRISRYGTFYADDGEISCSTFELTTQGRDKLAAACSIFGIGAFRAKGWRVHHNTFVGIRCNGLIASPAISFASGSRDTLVENNRILDSFVGIRFGTFQIPADAGNPRTYDYSSCGLGSYYEHVGGIIRNNVIWSATSTPDSGVALWLACGTKAVHNTRFSVKGWSSAA